MLNAIMLVCIVLLIGWLWPVLFLPLLMLLLVVALLFIWYRYIGHICKKLALVLLGGSLILFLFAAFLLFTGKKTTDFSAADNKKLVVGYTDTNLIPLFIYLGSKNVQGVEGILLNEFALENDYSLKFVQVDKNDAFDALRRGDIDILAGANINSSAFAQKDIVPTRFYFNTEIVFIATFSDNYALREMEEGSDLKFNTIMGELPVGFVYSPLSAAYYTRILNDMGLNYVMYDNFEEFLGIMMLPEKRDFNIAITNGMVFELFIKSNYYQFDIVKTLDDYNLEFAFLVKEGAPFLESFNLFIDDFYHSGKAIEYLKGSCC